VPLRISINTFGKLEKKEEDTSSGIVLQPEGVNHFYESSPDNSNKAITSSSIKERDLTISTNSTNCNNVTIVSGANMNQDLKVDSSKPCVEDNVGQLQKVESCLSELVVEMNLQPEETLSYQSGEGNILSEPTLLQNKPDRTSSELNQTPITSVKVTSRADLSHVKHLQTFRRPKPLPISVVTGTTNSPDKTSSKTKDSQDETVNSPDDTESITSSRSSNKSQTSLKFANAEVAESLPVKPGHTPSPSANPWPSLQLISKLKESSEQSGEPSGAKLRKSSVTRSFVIEQVSIKPLVSSTSNDSSTTDLFRHPEVSKYEDVHSKQFNMLHLPQTFDDKQNTKSPINFDEFETDSSQYPRNFSEEINSSSEATAGLYQAIDCMLKSLDAPSVQFYLLFTALSTALAAAAGTVSAFSPPLLVMSGALVVVVTESLRLVIERGRRQLLTSLS